MRKWLSFLLAVSLMLCLAGCANQEPKVWEWAQELKQEDIISAEPWRDDWEHIEMESLDDEDLSAFVMLLNALNKDSFTKNKHLRGGTSTYGMNVVIGSEIYHIHEAIGPHGALEMSYNGDLWWIDDEALSDFIQKVSSGNVIE